MQGNPQFAVPISAVDKFSAVFDKVKKTAGAVLDEVGQGARDTSRAFGALADPISRLAGVGLSGVGLAALAEGFLNFARAGDEVGRTAARLGTTTQVLQSYDRTVQTITGSHGAAAAALENLNTKLRGAYTGRDAEAAGVFNAYGIAVRGMNGQMRRSAEILPLIQQKLREIRDPIARAELAMWAFGGAWKDILDTAMASPATLDAATKSFQQTSAAENKALSDAAIASRAVTVSLGSLGEKITADFAPTLTRALVAGDHWLDTLRQSPEQLHRIEIAAGVVATAIGVTLVSSIALAVGAFNAWWALPAMTFLLSAAGAATVFGATLGAEIKGNPDTYPLQQTPGGYRPGDTMGGMIGRGHGAAVAGAAKPGFFSRVWNAITGGPSGAGAAVGSGAAAGPGRTPEGGFAAGDLGLAQQAIYQIESKSGRDYKSEPYDGHGASGPMQMMPDTFTANALPGEQSANFEDNMRAGKRYIERLYAKYGGDLDKVAYAYANGEGAQAKREATGELASTNPGYLEAFRANMAYLRSGKTFLDPAAAGGGTGRDNPAGAYGVPGAVMNYGGSGALGEAGTNLVTVKTNSGKSVTLNRAAAPSGLAMLNELEGRGYKIDSLGGFNPRDKAGGGGGLSEHAFGTAFDVNPERNPFRSDKTDLPKDVHDIAAKHGWVWGGDWKDPKDTMHFQWGGPGDGTGKTWAAVGTGGPAAEPADSTTHVAIRLPEVGASRVAMLNAAGPATAGLRIGRAMQTN